ncbi:MAG: hypothetical protein KatS3mg082_2923 [Nitrospiraceae bacterium]|nr:MAG: hypothetical protein KatS3mg081_2448 [Gemmatimonadales bacterium]GIW56519.1 MAG: hypothetical protein KatS3mg082_2923 [Nitrospiraceae bacterium]
MQIEWTALTAVAAGLTAIAALVTAVIYARMLRIMARDLTVRQRPYVFVERLSARLTGTGIPKDPGIRIRSSQAADALDLRMENWIYLKNAGPVPARMKPLLVQYRLDGQPLDTGETTTRVAVLFPGQQAHNIASLSEGLSRVLRRDSTLTLRIRIDYDHIDAQTPERYYSDIVLRYSVNEDNLWASSWDYDEASGA